MNMNVHMPSSKENISNLRHEAERLISGLSDVALHTHRTKAHILHGRHAQKKSGAGENFWQFRTYQDTDAPQNIDWRQSAKTDNVYIRQHEHQSVNRAFLWCAQGQNMDFSSAPQLKSKQVHAHLLMLSLSLLLIKSDEQIGIYGDIKTGRSERTLDKIMVKLSDKSSDDILPDISNFLLPSHTGFIGIGDFLSPIEAINQHIEFLAARAGSGLLIQVLDPAEIDLCTLSGRVHFEGINASETQLVNNVQAISSAYSQRIKEHNTHIHNICKHHGWHYILHRTDTPVEQTLHEIWEMNAELGGRYA